MATKAMDEMVRALRAQGAKVTRKGQKWRVTAPGKPLVFLPVADPKRQGVENKRADLRAKGYQV
ncbi:hypothetical protein [Streptomyces sp. AGS-58]|uniref:hypothetical protein n=1 Tax=unclassified Streptomyces TaxID=2593676 RepID=UPI0035A3409B